MTRGRIVACAGSALIGLVIGMTWGERDGRRDGYSLGWSAGRERTVSFEDHIERIRETARRGYETGEAEGRRKATEELQPEIDRLLQDMDTQAKQSEEDLKLAVERAWEQANKKAVRDRIAANEEVEQAVQQAIEAAPTADAKDKVKGNLRDKRVRRRLQ